MSRSRRVGSPLRWRSCRCVAVVLFATQCIKMRFGRHQQMVAYNTGRHGCDLKGKCAMTELDQYVLGHSAGELERLSVQARLVDPITRAFLRDGGLRSGMRVLDVGSGMGDVAFLAADLVGEAGEVIGVDRAQVVLERASQRAAARSVRNVSFRAGDPAEIAFDRPFDAIIGRYVLMFQRDPVAMLRKLTMHLRPGGALIFHEPDRDGVRSFPPVALYDQ